MSRKLGNSSVPPIGFGIMGISGYYGKTDSDEERFKVLDAAYENGCTHWDSADGYADSEELIGKWFKRTGKRDEIFLATKFGFTATGIRGDAAYVKEACEKSLKTLGVAHIDLYYIHRPDHTVPIEITIGAMVELVKEGKVKNIGISECTANDLRRAYAVHPIAALEVEYNPFTLFIEDESVNLLKTARELGVAIVAYSPLARGLVTGRYKSPDDFDEDDFRRSIPKFSRENFHKILGVVDKIVEVGKAHNATAGQVTLAWTLAQGEDFFVIPGTKSTKYLLENIGARDIKLTAEEVAIVRKIAEESEIPGPRYPVGEMGMGLVNKDTPSLGL